MNRKDMLRFIKESNAIENIDHFREEEVEEFERFLALEKVTVFDLEKFVSIYQHGAVLRDTIGMNVTIDGQYAPFGGMQVVYCLESILEKMDENGPSKTHCIYELLHPFTDCNGRSGRALWAWQMVKKEGVFPEYGFLRTFYYQTLGEMRMN